MKAAPEQLAVIRAVVRALGDLGNEAVFVGGMIRGLLLTDPGASAPRHTDDVDLVFEIASRSEYETKLSVRLRDRGFHEDDSPGAPLCRWVVGPIKVDVMPTAPEVFGFSNRWYAKAVRSAASVELPADGEGKVLLRVVSAPVFCATKLVAFRSRGGGNFDHSDLEDIVTVVDGRPELVRELEAEDDELRRFVGEEVRSLLAEGLEDALPGHLEGDASSQARLPLVRTALKRIARVPRVVQLDEVVRVAPGWEPGATGGAAGGPWSYRLLAVERAGSGAARIAVLAELTSHSETAGVTGDGRNIHVEDARGRRFPPLYKLLDGERRRRGLPLVYDQVVPNEPFRTVWVYEIPAEVHRLRLLLPDQAELPFEVPS